jgi:hypothetical protein
MWYFFILYKGIHPLSALTYYLSVITSCYILVCFHFAKIQYFSLHLQINIFIKILVICKYFISLHKIKIMTKFKTNKISANVSGSLHKMRAFNTYKEMNEQLVKLKQDVSFREYVGFEMAMQIFHKRYEKWLTNNN